MSSLTTDGAAEPQLLCVPPANVRQIWPHASPLIEKAMLRGGLNRFADIERDVLDGCALLWLASNGETIEAAAVTQLRQTEQRKVCILVACGGSDMKRWLALLDGIEVYAKAEGCDAMRIYGRRGWQRMLPHYQLARVILERKL